MNTNLSIYDWLMLWRDGYSFHNLDRCVPDGSCCYPRLKIPKEKREEFFQAVIENRMGKTFPAYLIYSKNAIAADQKYIGYGFRQPPKPGLSTTREWFMLLGSISEVSNLNLNSKNIIAWCKRGKMMDMSQE